MSFLLSGRGESILLNDISPDYNDLEGNNLAGKQIRFAGQFYPFFVDVE